MDHIISNRIREICLRIDSYELFDFNHKVDFLRLAEKVQRGKIDLAQNSVRFILANILKDNRTPRNLNYSGFFELIVIGEFEDRVRLVEDVSSALTEFYIDTEILPRIRPINEDYIQENLEKYLKIIEKTVIIYDRERNIF